MKKILIIEDNEKIRKLLKMELIHEEYLVDLAEDGEIGIKKFKEGNFDLILLDLMLPKYSGEEICKIIRKISNIPIIILTAKDQILNKIELLDMGADDYLTKPFNIQELFARMRVIFRNKKDFYSSNFIKYNDLKIHSEKKVLYIDEKEIKLTKTEYNLMYTLILNKEIVLSREKLIEDVWGWDFQGDNKIIDVYINALRKKIETKEKKYIKTVRGFGYILKCN
ncbi:response regulator transcription factor [Fusobacterium sp. IOR10]|uniref:response regulator transcription factor n=1 Tax=Fusobacterium sp. IOR10 TaxID=2665157 RepID=UPI0013D1640B|nr:response regulator transcription factor [Fusobacterium sp. IOR10]